MEGIPTDPNGAPRSGFRHAAIRNLDELESGQYWSKLRPYFLRPEYKRLRYAIQGAPDGLAGAETAVSVRAASQAGELDIAYVADRLAATMSITDAGLPDYCLTFVGQGSAVYTGASREAHVVDDKVGLIYRGTAGTTLAASGGHDRLSIWIPRSSVTQRLSALLGAPVAGEIDFHPTFDLTAPAQAALRRIVDLLVEELQSPSRAVLGSEAASRSFADLLIYTLLRTLSHSQSDLLGRTGNHVAPGTLRRAEAYIRAHVEMPIALHEVAAAAGCSVRSLQIAFRTFRDTTPLLAIRTMRLEAAREAMLEGTAGATVTEVALRYGFANPGRFTRLYRAAFGTSPRDELRRRQ